MIQYSAYESLNVNDFFVRMFKRSFKEIVLLDTKTEIHEDDKTKREHLILCRFCNNSITSPKYIIEINGKHNHSFSNPAGNTYRIGCFLYAKGCFNYGEPTSEYTWFPGFIWCYAICSSCHSHLGWHYQSAESSFYGLILNNLVENI